MECSLCKKPPDKEVFTCNVCKQHYCQQCSRLSSTEMRVMQLKTNRILKYNCATCQGKTEYETKETKNINLRSMQSILLEEIKKLHQELHFQDGKINDQSVLINRLLIEVAELKNLKQQGSYSNTVKGKTKNEVLVVKPREKQLSAETKNDLKQRIDRKRMAIAVENIKEGREGKVIINCSDVNSKEKIRKTVENQMGNKYSVVDAKQKNPKVIIRGVEE